MGFFFVLTSKRDIIKPNIVTNIAVIKDKIKEFMKAFKKYFLERFHKGRTFLFQKKTCSFDVRFCGPLAPGLRRSSEHTLTRVL
mgnify:CR=1 FL=1